MTFDGFLSVCRWVEVFFAWRPNLPDDKHERLKALAEARKISVNKLIDELATIALANHDARLRFEIRARSGNARRALELLDNLGDA